MKNITTAMPAASLWAAPLSSRERFGIAPDASVQGRGLSMGAFAAGSYGTGLSAALSGTAQHGTALSAAVRKDDARVPIPRGRQR